MDWSRHVTTTPEYRRHAMARVSTYLNFARSTEEAFNFYRSVFDTRFSGPIMRFGDVPQQPGQPPLSDADRNLVMHIELPILAGHMLMGTDAPESMGFTLTQGNTVTVNVEPDTRAEADRPLQAMFWGGYFGILVDKFGIRWMFNCASAT